MRATTMVRRLGAATLAALALSFSLSSSAVPSFLTQQGRLFDKESSEPVSGSVTLVFTIYDDPELSEAENVLWTETQTVTLDDGYFSAALGEEEALDPAIFDGSVRYLGVKAGADDEMTPRQAITSVPYALAVPWAGIKEHATPCTAPQFLRGFNASGIPQCAAPALSCTFRGGEAEAGVNISSAGCEAGEQITGGGCLTAGTLRSSAPFCLFGCAWVCQTTANTDITAYATCCRVQ